MAVRNCCYIAVCSAARGASAPTGEERGGGISTYRGGRPPIACYSWYSAVLQLLVLLSVVMKRNEIRPN